MKKLIGLTLCFTALCTSVSLAGNWLPKPEGSAAGLMERLDRAHWIASGARSPGRIVYVFTDPNCPYCNDLWREMRSARAADVQIRYLLVAVINTESRGKDAAILESPDPAATLEKHEQKFASGGVHPKAIALPETGETIAADESLMAALHIFGTPGLVYLDEHGEVKVFAGMPDAGQLQTIVGKR